MYFNSILLGGAPNANWTPLLLVLIGAIVIVKGVGWSYQFLKGKIRKNKAD